nr:MAG TPA: hypothetical protein [Caudoviricetes sp.]
MAKNGLYWLFLDFSLYATYGKFWRIICPI